MDQQFIATETRGHVIEDVHSLVVLLQVNEQYNVVQNCGGFKLGSGRELKFKC